MAAAVTRLIVPPLGGRSSRKISIGVPAVVKSIALSVRSVLPAKTTSSAIALIDVTENGTLPAFVDPTKTYVRSAVETKSFPLFA